MFDVLVDGFAAVTGCDRAALAALVDRAAAEQALAADEVKRPVARSDRLAVAGRLDRIGAAERLAAAVQAVQLRDLAAVNDAELAEGDATAWGGDRDRELGGVSRVVAVEVAKVCRVSVRAAGARIEAARRAVAEHPGVLGLVGTGAVSVGGLRAVLEATRVLDAPQARDLDRLLAMDVVRRALTPGELARAADRRVMAADPDAAAKRVTAARRRRSVRVADPVDGTATVFAVLRAEEALAVFCRLDGTARGMRSDGDGRSLDTLRADLLVEQLLGQQLTRLDRQPDTADTTGTPAGDPAGSGGGGSGGGDGGADGAVQPPVWCSFHGVEPAFDQAGREPPVVQDPDPPPDDPAWDRYTEPPPPPSPPMDPGAEPDDGSPRAPFTGVPSPGPPTQWRARVGVEVQVVVSLATVLGLDDEPGLLRGYGAVPAETIRRIVEVAEATGAGTRMRRLFCDPTDGRLLTMESTAPFFTGGLRQFGCWRDQADRLTGGPVGDLDHVHDRAAGGATTAANAQALGVLTNRVVKNHPHVTARTLPIHARDDGLDGYRVNAPDIEWTLPSGHTYLSQPVPALGLGSQPHQPPAPPRRTPRRGPRRGPRRRASRATRRERRAAKKAADRAAARRG